MTRASGIGHDLANDPKVGLGHGTTFSSRRADPDQARTPRPPDRAFLKALASPPWGLQRVRRRLSRGWSGVTEVAGDGCGRVLVWPSLLSGNYASRLVAKRHHAGLRVALAGAALPVRGAGCDRGEIASDGRGRARGRPTLPSLSGNHASRLVAKRHYARLRVDLAGLVAYLCRRVADTGDGKREDCACEECHPILSCHCYFPSGQSSNASYVTAPETRHDSECFTFLDATRWNRERS
jgi:hypothetical protein